MFEILFHKRAAKIYQKAKHKTAKKIDGSIERLKENPFHHKRIKKLHGKLAGKYRVKINSIRIIYRVEIDRSLVIIEAIGSRGDIYNKGGIC